MTVLDDRGRIAGRFNVIDIAAAVIVLIMVPLAIAAYLLFRTPPPTLTSVAPATLIEGAGQRIELNGTNLRPFMRVTFNTIPASAYLLGSTNYALVDLPPLRPGAYDVVLFDYAREVARLPKALTIAPVATDAELEVEGRFKSPAASIAAEIKDGATFSDAGRPIARVIDVAGPAPADIRLRIGDDTVVVPLESRDIAASLGVKCVVTRSTDGAARCIVPIGEDRIVVAPDALLTFQTSQGPVIFQIVRARAARTH